MSGTARVTRRIARSILRLTLLVVVPGVAILAGGYIYLLSGRYVETENAYVKAHIIAVSPDVDGRVVWVGVQDNQAVEEGDLLFRVDPVPFELAVARAEAKMAVERTEIESLRADYREALVQAREARERARFLAVQYERQKQLMSRKLGRQEQFDEALHDLNMGRERVRMIEERSRRVLAALGGDAELPVEKHPRYLQARAERDRAAFDLAKTAVVASADGVVSNMKLQVGEYVEEGDPVFSLIESQQVWVEANLKETQLTHVQVGQKATLIADTYPDHEWQATVRTIAPATGAEFALLPPQNATGNWVKVVQRVPVHLKIEGGSDGPTLRAGMTVSVRIDTRHRRELPALARRLVNDEGMPDAVRGVLRQSLALEDATRP